MKKEFNLDDKIEELIIRFLNGQLTVKEVDGLNKWIEESPENLHLFRSYQNVWLASSDLLPDERFSTYHPWKRVAARIKKASSSTLFKQRRVSRHIYLGSSKVAALIASMFIIGAITSYLIFMNYYDLSGDIYTEISVPQGSRTQIILPDNSEVWLNAGSTIKYRNNFVRSGRIVDLEGEAYFDVVTNKRKPFIVRTEQLNVRAYGTSFNVKAYPEDEMVSATLIEGNVVVEIPHLSETPISYNLLPRQNFTYNIAARSVERSEIIEPVEVESEISPDLPDESKPDKPEPVISLKNNIRPEIYTSWKDDIWVIEGETMAEMAVLLGRRFNTRINIGTDELKQYRFTGRIMNETLEQVLEILRLTTPLEYSVGKGHVEWMIDPDLKEEFDILLDKQGRI